MHLESVDKNPKRRIPCQPDKACGLSFGELFGPLYRGDEAWSKILEEVKTKVSPKEFTDFFERTYCEFADFDTDTIHILYPDDCPPPGKKCNRLVFEAISKLRLGINHIHWSPYEDGDTNGFQFHTLATTKAEKIDWIVRHYLPKGMLTYFFGPKGRGKTKICHFFTAGITKKQGQAVIRFNLEDDERAILKPCLYGAGANLDLVIIPDSIGGECADFSSPEHLEALRAMIIETKAVLVIIEPINNYKGAGKSNSEDDMRPIFMGLAQVARETGCAILAVGHTNKKRNVDVLDKAMGDGSHTRVARVNFFLERHPLDRSQRILANAGSNIHIGKALVFAIQPQKPFTLDGTVQEDVAVAVLKGKEEMSGDELLAQVRDTNVSDSEAIANFLIDLLSGKTEIDTREIRRAARHENPKWAWDLIKHVFRRKKLGTSRTEGGGQDKRTFWRLGGTS